MSNNPKLLSLKSNNINYAKDFVCTLLFSLIITSQAQNEKVKLEHDKKTGIVATETAPVFKVLEEKSAQLSSAKGYTIQNLDGKNLIVLAWNDFGGAR